MRRLTYVHENYLIWDNNKEADRYPDVCSLILIVLFYFKQCWYKVLLNIGWTLGIYIKFFF